MKLLQASPICGAKTDNNISLLLGFYPDQNTKYLPLVSRAFSGSSDCLTSHLPPIFWGVLARGEAQVRRDSLRCCLRLGAAAASRAPSGTRSHARAAAPRWLGKGGTAELDLDNLKFSMILTGGAAARAPFGNLEKQQALSEAAFLFWKRQNPQPTTAPKPSHSLPQNSAALGRGQRQDWPWSHRAGSVFILAGSSP